MKEDFLVHELKNEIKSLKKQRKILLKLIIQTEKKVSQVLKKDSNPSPLFLPWYWFARNHKQISLEKEKKEAKSYKIKIQELDKKILENEFFLKFMSH